MNPSKAPHPLKAQSGSDGGMQVLRARTDTPEGSRTHLAMSTCESYAHAPTSESTLMRYARWGHVRGGNIITTLPVRLRSPTATSRSTRGLLSLVIWCYGFLQARFQARTVGTRASFRLSRTGACKFRPKKHYGRFGMCCPNQASWGSLFTRPSLSLLPGSKHEK